MTKAPSAAETPKNFETALTELESLVQTMETGRLALEDSLSAYQRGMQLLKYCQEALQTAEQKIQVLETGVLRDFDTNIAQNTPDK